MTGTNEALTCLYEAKDQINQAVGVLGHLGIDDNEAHAALTFVGQAITRVDLHGDRAIDMEADRG